ncbi:MAG TPA: DUF998 domain-containing protein [Micromonosporaceae bacterium]|jgi:Protein of unknown function (DUF998)
MVTSRPGPPAAHLFAVVAVGGIAFAVLLGIAGHLEHPPGLNPVSLTISDYALSDRGGPVDAAILSLGLGSLALLLGLRDLQAPVRGMVTGLLSVWAAGLVCAVAVPTDPIGTPLSPSGQFHRYASVAAFVALPAAAVLLSHRLTKDGRWHGLSAYLRWLAATCGVGLLALLYVAFPGDRAMIGVVERLLVAAEVALVGLLAGRLWQLVRGFPAPCPGCDQHRMLVVLPAASQPPEVSSQQLASDAEYPWPLPIRATPRFQSPRRNAPRWK